MTDDKLYRLQLAIKASILDDWGAIEHSYYFPALEEYAQERERAAAKQAVEAFAEKVKKRVEEHLATGDYFDAGKLDTIIDQLLKAELGEGK